ncbi:hypothetical protein F5Y14DRAFT_247611 [Nemania sp. NC0429]|nr:hypothetical protein F5Y14DRAFT_247611 [Nemania sp. NC0429]
METRQEVQARSGHLRKACHSCIRAKRRCDKSLPSCRRCVDKEVPCEYPSTRPYARRKPPQPPNLASESPAEKVADLVSLEETSDAVPSTSQLSWDDECIPQSWLHPAVHGQDHDSDAITPLPLADSDWFLKSDSWSVHEYDLAGLQPRISVSHWKRYVECLRRWLSQWVADSHCPFIHRHLYAETGLPSCLQDAYSTLAAYIGKTDNNEEVVMQIVEDKANALLRQHETSACSLSTESWGIPGSVSAACSIRERLARVQALFIYQFIRLFDGDIRHRAQAEQHNVTLQQWRMQLWEATKLAAYLRQTVGGGGGFSSTGSYDACEPTTWIWEAWVLAESVRRTWIVVNYTHSVYETLRDGQGSCPGSITYTLRRGLWDAMTPAEWCRLAHSQDPLFMRSDPPDVLFAKASPREVNEFGLSIVSIMWDSRRIDSWFTKAPDTNLEELLRNKF